MNFPFTHVAASDDSKHQDGQFNSLSLVTLKYCDAGKLQREIFNILKESEVKELKWHDLDGARDRFAANKIIEFVFNNYKKIRIDILVWDLNDSRHRDLIKRDDNENLVRMYYHLVYRTLSKYWPTQGNCWKWRPDEQVSVNWDTLYDCLNNKLNKCVRDLFQNNPDFEKIDLRRIIPSNSIKYPLIQIADLFAGMGAYSWGHYEKFKKWKIYQSKQATFFPRENLSFSQSEKERFKVIDDFNAKCKKNGLRIAFDSTNGFKSHNPYNFINFWFYEPQSILDKAPKKGQKNS